MSISSKIKAFLNEEEGLTILEYVIGAALIVAAIIASGFWDTIRDKLNNIALSVSAQ